MGTFFSDIFSNIRKGEKGEWLFLFLLTAGCFLIFHRELLLSGFDLLSGDAGDARLNIIIADSWRDYFSGRLPLRSTRIFYPYPNSQGFTDLSLTLFLFSAPLRLLGLDEMRSVQLLYILLLFLGSFSFFYLARKVLKFSFPISLTGALFIVFNNAFFHKIIRTQFYFLMLVPLFTIFFVRFWQNWKEEQREKQLFFYGAGAVLTYAVIAYSNFYTSFFIALFLFFFFLSWGIYLLVRKGALHFTLKKAGIIVGLILFFILLFLPFFYIYKPLLSETFYRTWEQVSYGLPVATDILNFGKENLLWGGLYERFFPPIHKDFLDHVYGLPPLSFLLAIFSLFCFWKQVKKDRKVYPLYIFLLLSSMILTFIFTVKPYPFWSLYYVIWKYFPGGRGIGAVARIYVFLMLPLALFIMGVMEEKLREYPRKKQLLLASIGGLLLLADHLNDCKLYSWSISRAKSKLEKAVPPPADCQSFFLKPAPPNKDVIAKNIFQSQMSLEAWNMAKKYKIFTLNGYSGNVPRDEDGRQLGGIAEKDYSFAVERWIKKWNLKNVYMYDWEKNRFLPYTPGIAIEEERRLRKGRK